MFCFRYAEAISNFKAETASLQLNVSDLSTDISNKELQLKTLYKEVSASACLILFESLFTELLILNLTDFLSYSLEIRR